MATDGRTPHARRKRQNTGTHRAITASSLRKNSPFNLGHAPLWQFPTRPEHSFDLANTERLLQSCSTAADLQLEKVEWLPDHLSHIRPLNCSESTPLILKVGPPISQPLLRSERNGLETEISALLNLAYQGLPISTLVKYAGPDQLCGLPLLLVTELKGRPLKDIKPQLSAEASRDIERQITKLEQIISKTTLPHFGPITCAVDGPRFRTWRQAFTTMFRNVLMDGEDAYVNLPYYQIYDCLRRCGPLLAEVEKPSIIVPGLRESANILTNEEAMEVTGLLDFKKAFLGDGKIFDKRDNEDPCSLLYACYFLTERIVTCHYRLQSESMTGEIDIRKELKEVLVGLERALETRA
jgi:hypothetical protein